MGPSSGTFSAATLNVHGLGSIEKLGTVFEAVKDVDICCLQETHFLDPHGSVNFRSIFSQRFRIFESFATIDDSMAGVALMFNHNFLGIADNVVFFELQVAP